MRSWRFSFNAAGRGTSLCVLAVFFVGAALGDSPLPPSSAAADPARDCRLTLRARQALQQDASLALLPTLGVTVRSGVATLWGSVPSAEQSRRAEKLLRQLPGIFEVGNELEVESANDPLVEFLRSPTPRRPMGGPESLWFLANRPSALLGTRPDDFPAAPPRSAESPAVGITLLPPVRLDAPVMSAVHPARTPDLGEAIDRLRRSDPRFGGIQVQVRQGIVWLSGTRELSARIFELAQAVSRLRGVERVIVQEPPPTNGRP
jgi:hypothetical protein